MNRNPITEGVKAAFIASALLLVVSVWLIRARFNSFYYGEVNPVLFSKASGVVNQNEVVPHTARGVSTIRFKILYRVDKKIYECSNETGCVTLFGTSDTASEVLKANLASASSIPVYYDPKNPKICFLNVAYSPVGENVFFLGVVLGLSGVWALSAGVIGLFRHFKRHSTN